MGTICKNILVVMVKLCTTSIFVIDAYLKFSNISGKQFGTNKPLKLILALWDIFDIYFDLKYLY